MQDVVVLNLLFRTRPYSDTDIKTISRWIKFFQKKGLHVIATPPRERREVFDRLDIPNKEIFTPHTVTSFDTCDRWLSGLLKAQDLKQNFNYVYLWSADFKFTKKSKCAALQLLKYTRTDDLVVGTIQASGTKKNAIDNYATGPLLQCWFPNEYDRMQEENFSKPRSELLRFSKGFLESTLNRRWYPTEQTIYLILQCFWQKRSVTSLTFKTMRDSEEARLSPDVVQQIERMELWLKYIWRDHYKDWDRLEYLLRCHKSFSIVATACRQLLYS